MDLLQKISMDPTYTKPRLTETSQIAYELLSDQLVTSLTPKDNAGDYRVDIQQVADMFLYANIDDYPKPDSHDEMIWKTIMHAMQEKDGDVASKHIHKLLFVRNSTNNTRLSALQTRILHLLKEYCTTLETGQQKSSFEL
jgi:hypothetical protein